MTQMGKSIQSRAGPFEEGSDLTLVCEVSGGKLFLIFFVIFKTFLRFSY